MIEVKSVSKKYKKVKAPPYEALLLKVCVYSIKEGKFAK